MGNVLRKSTGCWGKADESEPAIPFTGVKNGGAMTCIGSSGAKLTA
jgi:hypothetical protein